MSTLAQLIVKIGADVSGLTKGLDTAQQKMTAASEKIQALGSKVSSAGKTLSAAVTLPIIGAATASFKLASDYQESINKVDVAFKDNAAQVKAWSNNTLTQFGLAKGTVLDMAATYGDMATSMGLSTEQAAAMSTSMVGLAGDLASFKNIGIEQANTALAGIFTGETESLKQLGIVMTQANLDEYALAQGIRKKTKDMSQAEQVQLRYNYVMEKTKNAQGDFARTGDGAANQMRIFGESLKELGITMGENLLPVITPIITGINNLIKHFGTMSPATQKMVILLAGIAAAVGPVLMAIGAMASGLGTVIKMAGTVGKGIGILSKGFALLTGPVGIAIAVIAGLITIGYLVYKNWDSLGPKLAAVWQGIKDKAAQIWNNLKQFLVNWWPALLIALTGPVGAVAVLIIKNWDKIKTATTEKFAAIKYAVTNGWNGIKSTTMAIWAELKGFIADTIGAIGRTINGLFDKLEQIKLKAKGAVQGVSWNFTGTGTTASWASGTPFHPGGLAWVGEKGPELIDLPRGTRVYSHEKSLAMISGSQKVEHYGTITYRFETQDGNLVAKIAKEFEQGNRRIPARVATMPSMA